MYDRYCISFEIIDIVNSFVDKLAGYRYQLELSDILILNTTNKVISQRNPSGK